MPTVSATVRPAFRTGHPTQYTLLRQHGTRVYTRVMPLLPPARRCSVGPSTAGVAFSFGGASDGSNRRGETLCVSAPEPRELVAYGLLNGVHTTRAIMFLLVPLLMGCTGVHTVRYALIPEANVCQVTEVRATAMSTLVSGVCWDDAKQPIGMAGGPGKPAISVPLDVLSSAATLAGPIVGAAILGRYMLKAAEGLQLPVSGRVDVVAPQIPSLPPLPVIP